MSSHKTVDGRGARVVVEEGGACFTLRKGRNIIVHDITRHNFRHARKAASRRRIARCWTTTTCQPLQDMRIERCSLKAYTYGFIDVTEASIVVTHPLGEPRTTPHSFGIKTPSLVGHAGGLGVARLQLGYYSNDIHLPSISSNGSLVFFFPCSFRVATNIAFRVAS
jgi:hypothetical protein